MYTLPNLLTMSRIVVIPAIFLMVYIHSSVWQVFAAVLFIIASITDYFGSSYGCLRIELHSGHCYSVS